MIKKKEKYDVCIVGGCGHVGLPLGLSLAEKEIKVCLYDKDRQRSVSVGKGKMPFIEYGADSILKRVLKKKMLKVSNDISVVGDAKYLIIAIGTPVDEYLNPKIKLFLELFKDFSKYLNNQQIIIIRSTVYPHTCQRIASLLDKGPWHISYCPERIAQGYAIKELKQFPQIVAGLTETAVGEASKLFSMIAPKVIKVSLAEAELVKLFSNAWRYLQFAAANQFYMIAYSLGVDFNRLRKAMRNSYGRAAALPSAGFAAGPCLLKDTMQLASFYNNNFLLGHVAMMINEGLPNFIVENLRQKYNLASLRIGILGMAFKADIDDTRDSLSYKLGKILKFHSADVLYSDEYVKNDTFATKEEIISSCDVIIVAVPHSAYKKLKIPKDKKLVDLWGVIKTK
jgi:UDP-N-acetyl-D-mannosaminuronic acid dehydrogenase